MDTTYSTSNNSTLVADICKDKEVAFDFQKRKHPNWLENYLLYRDKVITNRLTQRQSINVPIMAETLTAWLSKIDEAPLMTYAPRNSKDVNEKRVCSVLLALPISQVALLSEAIS